MRSTKNIVGLVLIVIGLVSLLVGGIRWKEDKTVLDIGGLKATTEEHKMLPIPPVVGALALVGGIVLLVAPVRNRT